MTPLGLGDGVCSLLVTLAALRSRPNMWSTLQGYTAVKSSMARAYTLMHLGVGMGDLGVNLGTGGPSEQGGWRPPDSIEEGLRDLAKNEGPTLEKLIYPQTAALRTLMSLTASLEDSGFSAEKRARAMMQLIREQIASLNDHQHPKCKEALQAAFYLTPELPSGLPSITARLNYMLNKGAFGEKPGREAGERNWRRGVRRLAGLLEENIEDLYRQVGWADTGLPSAYQPVRVRRLIVTYFLANQSVTDLFTERTVEATEDGVDRYIVRDYIYGDLGANIEIGALMNCKKISQLPVNLPGYVAAKAEMRLPEAYAKGKGCTFATRVTRSGMTKPTTWQEIQVTSHGILSLVMRVQFDLQTPLPERCWYFAAMPDVDRLEEPATEEKGRDITISRWGYAEHSFGPATVAAKYGVAWRWPE